MEWSNEQELVTIIHNELFTAVIGDILDDHGYRHQFLPPNVRPLSPSMKLVGRAMPVLEADVYDTRSPYGLIFEALDALQPGEIYIGAGASSHYALWGELMTTAATARGAVGAVINGSIRDVSGILSFEQFPVFCTGITGQDQKGRGRAIDYRVPVQIGGVMIEPGAMIIGDMDGVVVVPKAVEESVFTRSLAKARTEKTIKKDLENGMLATIAFKKYGIM
jgi:regulator of RNase E activity RraA